MLCSRYVLKAVDLINFHQVSGGFFQEMLSSAFQIVIMFLSLGPISLSVGHFPNKDDNDVCSQLQTICEAASHGVRVLCGVAVLQGNEIKMNSYKK